MDYLNKRCVRDMNIKGKTVFLRCDFNVPLDKEGNITDTRRIDESLKTIKYLIDNGSKIILCSHLGRPKEGFDEKFSLLPVAKYLSEVLGRKIKLTKDICGEDTKRIVSELKPGEVCLLENIRFAAIRGNISEIKAIALGSGGARGVDADVADSVTDETLPSVIEFAREFSIKTGAVTVITGATDLVVSKDKQFIIKNGHPMMSSVTGTGCMLSAMTAAYLGANPGDEAEACAAAVCAMGLCGELAHERLSERDGNSTYRNMIIDEIYNLTPQKLEEGAKITVYNCR